MTVAEQIADFSERFGQEVTVNNVAWHYYALGSGPAVLWLTGGLRRAAFAFGFMEKLAERHRVVAPDYRPVRTIGEYNAAFDAVLAREGIATCGLCGQSYGGMLAQAYLAHNGPAVERLILSSTGPADYGRAWLPVEALAMGLARLLPENTVKRLLAGGLLKVVSVPAAERAEWEAAVRRVFEHDLTRSDVISHFAVAADLIDQGTVRPGAFAGWPGRVIVLSAENDRTQSRKDIPRYERLFGRPVAVVSMGEMGHTAVLFDPAQFAAVVEKALA